MDFHCDTMYRIHAEGSQLFENKFQIDLRQSQAFDFYGQFFALYCGEEELLPSFAPMKLDRLLHTAEEQLEKNKERIMLCRSSEDMHKARKHGKTAAFLSLEGAELVPDAVSLKKAWQAGVRLITLTWNHKNVYGCGAAAGQEGLTEQGRCFVKDLENMGIIPDVSHLSERGFWDVAEICRLPFVATHSNARSLCDHIRNLTDLQFQEICRKGGVVGINLYSPFLRENGRANLDDVIGHIEHFCSLGGAAHIVLGCDLDGCDQLPDGICRLEDLQNLYEALLRHNYPEALVQGIFFQHLWDFLSSRI